MTLRRPAAKRTRKTTRPTRRPAQIKGRFTALKSKRQNWCRHIRDERSADLSRPFTGKRFNRARAHGSITWGLVTRHEHDSRHYDRRKWGKCRRPATRHVRRRMYSRIIVIW